MVTKYRPYRERIMITHSTGIPTYQSANRLKRTSLPVVTVTVTKMDLSTNGTGMYIR
jgi:hypothetical protein